MTYTELYTMVKQAADTPWYNRSIGDLVRGAKNKVSGAVNSARQYASDVANGAAAYGREAIDQAKNYYNNTSPAGLVKDVAGIGKDFYNAANDLAPVSKFPAQWAEAKARRGLKSLKRGINSGIDSAKQYAGDVAAGTGAAINEGVDAVTDAAKRYGSAVSGGVDTVRELGRAGAGAAKAMAGNTARNVAQAYDNAGTALNDAYQGGKNWAYGAANAAGNAVNNAVAAGARGVSSAADTVLRPFDRFFGATRNAVNAFNNSYK